jgi:hypothetical protein
MKSIREQLADNASHLARNGKKQRLRTLKTDRLHWRISRRLREMAKLYAGIDGYYQDEDRVADYIFQIIRQAIKEVEDEKDNSRN